MFNWLRKELEEAGVKANSSNSSSSSTAEFQSLFQTFIHCQKQSIKYGPDLRYETRLIEALRRIAELMVYGEQEDEPIFFDYFCEKSMLEKFCALVIPSDGVDRPSSAIQIQLLQSLSILLQNLSKPTSIFYLLSNNYVNSLIQSPFDTDTNEEVRDWYVTFLKALSIRLDSQTIQFFFNSANGGSFPLLTEAVKFATSNENMIRIAVRTVTLQVFRVQDDALRSYVCSPTGSPMQYLESVVDSIRANAIDMQALLDRRRDDDDAATDSLATQMDHFVEALYYIQDIFEVGNILPQLAYQLGEMLYTKVLYSLLIKSIIPNAEERSRVSTMLALNLLSQVFQCISHSPVLNAICYVVLHPENYDEWLYKTVSLSIDGRQVAKTSEEEQNDLPHGIRFHSSSPSRLLERDWTVEEKVLLSQSRNVFRNSLTHLLSSQDSRLSYSSALFLCTVLDNSNVDESLLEEANLLPQRKNRAKKMLKRLTSSPKAASNNAMLFPAGSDSSSEDDEEIENTNKYSTTCVHALLSVMRLTETPRCNLQIAIRLLLDLVLDEKATSPYLSAEHSVTLQHILSEHATRVLESNFDLEVFQEQVRAIELEAFPIEVTLRLVSDPMQFMKKDNTKRSLASIQSFWYIRKLYLLVVGPSTAFAADPLSDATTLNQVLEQESITAYEGSFVDFSSASTIPCVTKQEEQQKQPLRVILNPSMLLLANESGIVHTVFRMGSIQADVDKSDPRVLDISEKKQKKWSLLFHSDEDCQSLLSHLVQNKRRIQEEHMQCITNSLKSYK